MQEGTYTHHSYTDVPSNTHCHALSLPVLAGGEDLILHRRSLPLTRPPHRCDVLAGGVLLVLHGRGRHDLHWLRLPHDLPQKVSLMPDLGSWGERSCCGYQSGQCTIFSGACIITVLQCVYTWRILQLCGRSEPVPTETSLSPQNLEPRDT